jgi:PiT family inorganic phosphate transporter
VTPVDAALAAGVFAFAGVTGANNGGTLVAVQLRGATNPPWVPVVVLAVAVGVGPAVLGTGVARTIAEDLAVFDGTGHAVALATVLVVSVALVGLLSARGLPTSLFAALIGALTGVGLGLGLGVDGGTVGAVFLAAALTPWAGAGLAWAVTRAQRWVAPTGRTWRWVARRQFGSFLLLCVAYGANGAQVMVALLALALQRSPGSIGGDAWLLCGLASCFAAGSVVGLFRLSSSVGSGIVALRPRQVATAKVASTAAVVSAAAVGLPVSTTQVVTASLVGCGAAEGYRRIRWQHAQRIALAWLITVPAAFVAAGTVGLVARAFI